MKTIIAALILITAAIILWGGGHAVIAAEPFRTQTQRDFVKHTVQAGGLERVYYVYAPETARRGPAPLLIAFHGGGQNAQKFVQKTGLKEAADQHGFIIAAAEGVADPRTGEQSWNTGSPTPRGYAETTDVDDLAFVRKIIDDSRASGLIDSSRIYAAGVSRGGMMAYWAACNFGSRDFTAIAAVSATLSSGHCPRPQGVSLLHVHGTEDERITWLGGKGRFTPQGADWESAWKGVQTFASGARCANEWTTRQVTSDTACHATSCPGSQTVEYCLIEGGGHAWPGVPTNRRQKLQGVYSSMKFNATEAITQFFAAH